MRPMAMDIADKLEELNLGTFASQSGWGIFISSEPAGLSTTITLYDVGGQSPQYIMNGKKPVMEYPMMQIRTRAPGYQEAGDKLTAVLEALEEAIPFETADSSNADMQTAYRTFSRTQEPTWLEKTAEGKNVWVCTVRCSRKQIAVVVE